MMSAKKISGRAALSFQAVWRRTADAPGKTMMTVVRPVLSAAWYRSAAGTANKKAAEGSLQQLASLMRIVDQTRPITA